VFIGYQPANVVMSPRSCRELISISREDRLESAIAPELVSHEHLRNLQPGICAAIVCVLV
jgi:hypothetical protein